MRQRPTTAKRTITADINQCVRPPATAVSRTIEVDKTNPPSQCATSVVSNSAMDLGQPPQPSAKKAKKSRCNIFVVAVNAGVGSVIMAIKALGATFSGIIIEQDHELRRRAQDGFPHIAVAASMSDGTTKLTQHLALQANATQFLMTYAEQELDQGVDSFVKFKDVMNDWCEKKDIVFKWFLTSSASMSQEERSNRCEQLQCQPTIMHAADWGWIHASILIWGMDSDDLNNYHDTKIETFQSGELLEDVAVIRWRGPPVPASPSVKLNKGTAAGTTTSRTPGIKWAPTYRKGRFTNSSTSISYDQKNELMGYGPRSAFRKGLSLLHLPSLMLIIAILLGQPLPSSAADDGGGWSDQHVPGTAWEMPTIASPLDTTPQVIIDRMRTMLPAKYIHEEEFKEAAAKLSDLPLFKLQAFNRWAITHGVSHGPDIEAVRSKVEIHAAAQRQHKMPGAAQTAAGVIPHDVSAEVHIQLAKEVQHPFTKGVSLEKDAEFAIEGAARWGPQITTHQNEIFAILRSVARALKKVDARALAARPVGHVPGMRPATTAFMIATLQWPDVDLPRKLIEGFEIAGVIQPSHVFRNETRMGGDLEDLLEESESYINMLEADSRPHKEAENIMKTTDEEIAAGYCSEYMTRQEVDDRFGRGKWSPVPRHVILQNDKCRPVDDGRSSKTNSHTTLSETIVCLPSAYVTAASRLFWAKTSDLAGGGAPPSWSQLVWGNEDMEKGYRQNHPQESHMGLSVTTFVHPTLKKRVYNVNYGLLFGLTSCVVQFNRMPTLATAIVRRFLLVAQGHYFDDLTDPSIASLAAETKSQVVRLYSILGIKLSVKKRKRLKSMCSFLGVLHDMSTWHTDAAAVLGPSPTSSAKAIAAVNCITTRGNMSQSEAAKLRGQLQWLDSTLLGRPCRPALACLAARQYNLIDGTTVEGPLKDALEYLAFAAEVAPSRAVSLSHKVEEAPTIVYTDASARGKVMRIGILIIPPHGIPHVGSYDVPSDVYDVWDERRQYIALGELLAGPVAAHVASNLLAGKDILWYIDNVGALSVLIKNTSRAHDCAKMGMLMSASMMLIQARPWFEYIQSDQNPSDVLSRDGLEDPVVARNIREGKWATLPAVSCPWKALLGSYQEVRSLIAALGVQ